MLILLFLFAVFNASSSAPTSPPLDTVGQPIPLTIFGRELPECINVARCRTMQDIVWSCLATIFACTWVAVHPNVPDSRDSGWTIFKQRVTIMVYAALGPEFVTMWALRQRIGAAKHVKEYNKKFHDGAEPLAASLWDWFRGGEKTGGPWTVTHGFLLEMEGLVLYKDGTRSGVIREVSELSKRFDISEKEINDKSKGDFLTKLLVVLQTTWFISQCLARWIMRLPVTELEVLTLGFAFLNIITYTLWWNKPQNMCVAIPIHVCSPPEDPPCKMCGSLVGEKMDAIKSHEMEDRLGSGGAALRRSGFNSESIPRTSGGCGESRDEECIALLPSSPSNAGACRFLEKVARGTKEFAVCLMGWTQRIVKVFSSVFTKLCQVSLLPDNWRDMALLDWIGLIIVGPVEPLLSMMAEPLGEDVPFRVSPMFYSSVVGLEDGQTYLPFCIIAVAFGCIHLVPIWMPFFPSHYEEVLWQASALVVTIQPGLLLCARSLFGVRENEFTGLLYGFILLVGGLGYVIARLVLIIIAFTSLRDLPLEAYQNIAWSTFLLHF